MNELEEAVEGDLMRLAACRVEPVGEAHEARIRFSTQQHLDGAWKAAGVRNHLPVARKAHDALHVAKTEAARFQHGIRRVGA